MIRFIKLSAVFFLMGAGVHGAAMAKDGMPLAMAGNLSITVAELEADFMRMPEQARKTASADPAAVSQSVANLVVRKLMALQAQSMKLDQNPLVQTQLELLKDRILSDAWLAEVDKKNVPSDADVERLAQKKYQEEAFTRFKEAGQIKVRHILFEKSEEGKALAEDVLKQIKAGGDFAQLAKQYSKDPGSATRGGDLGQVGKGRMVPAFEQAAFSLKKAGELSDLVETGFGYHIIRLDEPAVDRIVPYVEVKAGLMQEVANKLRTDARNAAAADMFKQVKLSDEAIQNFVEAAKAAKK